MGSRHLPLADVVYLERGNDGRPQCWRGMMAREDGRSLRLALLIWRGVDGRSPRRALLIWRGGNEARGMGAWCRWKRNHPEYLHSMRNAV